MNLLRPRIVLLALFVLFVIGAAISTAFGVETERAVAVAVLGGLTLLVIGLSILGRMAMHWRILASMGVGVVGGIAAANLGSADIVADTVAPMGKLFLNLLKMVAVPLVLFSLVAGVASLNDTSKVGRIGGKTILLYLGTTAVAIALGLLVASVVRPGSSITEETRQSLLSQFSDKAQEAIDKAGAVEGQMGVWDFLISVVPTNPFGALAVPEMLQVVLFALLLGLALTRLGAAKAEPVVTLFQRLSDAVIELVHMVMKLAPLGVFALIAGVLADLGKDPEKLEEVGTALLSYMATVLLALFLHGLLVYTSLLAALSKVPIRKFFRAMVPAQLVALSTSSSAATLPVTIDCCEKGVGVDEEVSSFVLPIGATINMDGTGLYQGVAAVFIATVYGMDLTLGQQLGIVLTAALASIGTAAVPGVGLIMLVIVLKQAGIPAEGVGLILAVDRPLDMARTVLNVTGDATVCTIVASSEGLIEADAGAEEGSAGEP